MKVEVEAQAKKFFGAPLTSTSTLACVKDNV